MTATIGPISANSLVFVVLAAGLIAVAWSGARSMFPAALALVSIVVLGSWLQPLDVAALVLFLVPPYIVIRRVWGKEQAASFRVLTMVVVWEVLLFVYLRKYEWTGELEWMDHPIAIIGISYMLFRIIHLIVEAPYMGHLPFGPVQYGTYLLAFWTLLSGPIQRYDDYVAGMGAVGRPTGGAALAAAHRLINGLIKAFVIAPIFLKASSIEALTADDANWVDFLIVLYAYPAYLYLNFSGYTDFVIAIARLCGMNTLPENFNRPYLARNLVDFWSRWHMSFGTWIRHYVFTPLSKYLLRATAPPLHNLMLAVCVVVTFLIVGAWHGTTLNFVIFGLLHAAGIIAIAMYGRLLKSVFGRQLRKKIESHTVVRAFSTVLCFHFVAATVLLFPNSAGKLATTFSVFFS